MTLMMESALRYGLRLSLLAPAGSIGHTFRVVFEIDQNSFYKIEYRAARCPIEWFMVDCREVVDRKTRAQKSI